MTTTRASVATLIGLMAGVSVVTAQGTRGTPQAAASPAPPTRDPHTPGYVTAAELPDGQVPSPDVEGNFIIGPTHNPAPEMTVHDGVPQGTVYTFTMSSVDSKIYPGICARHGRAVHRWRGWT